jgi:transcriptional antiterminator RfaH
VENLLRAGNGEALSTALSTAIGNHNLNQNSACAWQAETERRWYAAYTAPCHEKQVASHFAVHRIEHFLPLYASTRRWASGRTVNRECPLFPSYIFVQIDPRERVKVLGTPGIVSLVGTSKGATALPRAEIETLRRSLHLCHALPHPFLGVGEKARIRSGPLAGMQGIVLRHHQGTRIVLSLDLIMQSIAVEVDVADLEPVEFRLSALA